MRSLPELVDAADPARPLVEQWIREARRPVEVLTTERHRREQALLTLQVTTRSPMGALAYQTGGLLIDHGQLRFCETLHWPGWEQDVAAISPDQGYSIYPPQTAEQGSSPASRSRRVIAITELWAFNQKLADDLRNIPKGATFKIEVMEQTGSAVSLDQRLV